MKTDVSHLNRLLKGQPTLIFAAFMVIQSYTAHKPFYLVLSCLVLMPLGQERDKWVCLIVKCKLTPFSKLVYHDINDMEHQLMH